MAGLEELARRLSVTRAGILAATDQRWFGTTVASISRCWSRKGRQRCCFRHRGPSDVVKKCAKASSLIVMTCGRHRRSPLVPRELRFGSPDGSGPAAKCCLLPLDAEIALDDAITRYQRKSRCDLGRGTFCMPISIPRMNCRRPAVEAGRIGVSRSNDDAAADEEYERVSTDREDACTSDRSCGAITNLEARRGGWL
jgi:hypothetical protein